MQTTFTIEEIKNYLQEQDSLGDIHFNLSEQNIIRANQLKYPIEGEGDE